MATEFVEADASYDEGKLADRIAQQKSALERDLYESETEEEITKILSELQGNIVKATEKARR